MKLITVNILLILFANANFAQNSMVGDGFGGRLWYKPTKFSVGSYSGYTICEDTTNLMNTQLYGWGSNGSNQLGLGPSIYSVDYPELIPNMNGVKYFTTGYLMGAIKYDSSGWVWGTGGGSGNDGFSQDPVQIMNDAYYCDAGSLSVSFVKNDGTVWSIGINGVGNFGNGQTSTTFQSTPLQMLNVSNAVRVANNGFSTSVLLSDSTVVTSGESIIGLGPTINQTSIPLPNPYLPKIVDLKSNASGTAALTANGDVYVWGFDGSNYYTTPVKIDSLSNIVAISGCDDGQHYFALDANKKCYAWGTNYGQFGAAQNGDISALDPVLVASDVIDIMAGETFSYIVKSNGSLWGTGFSVGGSIWLNLSNEHREYFVELKPETVPGWCTPYAPGGLIFPNIFTPNNDLVNDDFFFQNYELEALHATIFNRWGNPIKTFNDVTDKWDGKTNSGSLCEEGTYFFVVHYKSFNQDWKTQHGHITLTR